MNNKPKINIRRIEWLIERKFWIGGCIYYDEWTKRGYVENFAPVN